MRKRLLNTTDDEDTTSTSGISRHARRAMKVIQFNPRAKVVAIIIVVLSGIILLMNLPKFSSDKIDLDNFLPANESGNRYVSTGSLRFKDRVFLLDGQPFRIFGGAIHYFRIPEAYWDDILKKAKAAGLNTIDIYVPWNLHEDRPGIYYFAANLNIELFLQKIHDLGLYVILRPGPYICSEWDFGGLPGWLLKDPQMKVRSNYKTYMDAVDKWFGTLIPKISAYQNSQGGPIIAVQIENEFGSYSNENEHLLFVKRILEKHGITEMFMTSDNARQSVFYNDALPFANFQNFESGKKIFSYIEGLSKDFPLAVMEYWSGWFDHWGEPHETRKTNDILNNFEEILRTGASVSVYMFHGGTNFGFMAGANYLHTGYIPDVTSYDYGAPISEAGDTTPLYYGFRDLINKYSNAQPRPVPPNREKAAYGDIKVMSYLSWEHIIGTLKKDVKVCKKPIPMEYLNMQITREGYGQNYGYIVYSKTVPKFTKLEIKGTMKDRLQVIIDGERLNTVLDWKSTNYEIDVSALNLREGNHTLDLLVENLGRVNYVNKGVQIMNQERKGIHGEIYLDGFPVENWTVYPLSFNKNFIHKVGVNEKYQPVSSLAKPPCLFRTELKIGEGSIPKDTFLKMEGWGKGTVFINGYHLGRYWNIGPQRTLFVPGVYLNTGRATQILIFEEEKRGDIISFIDHPELS